MKKFITIFLLSLLALIILVPVALYIPFVQDFVVKIASEKVSEATGMKIEVGRLRLGFPLDLNVDDVTVIQANADTMLTARRASVAVELLPLLKGQVTARNIELDTAFYQLGNRDSLMWLRARVDNGHIRGAGMNLKTNAIDLDRADIDGVRVWMRMLNDTTAATPPDTAKSTPYLIKAHLINMSRVSYSMQMLPLIDSLGCYIDNATLRDGTVDMMHYRIHGQSLRVDSVAAAYIYPLATDTTSTSTAATAEPSSQNWKITADSLRLTARNALYAQRGVTPAKGFDPAYIQASDIVIEVDSFYNCGTDITVPLKKFQATERCGLPLYGDGLFTMANEVMKAQGFTIGTLRSLLRFNALMGIGDMMTDPNLPLTFNGTGRLDPADLATAFPDMAAMTAPLKPLILNADIDGTTGELNVYSLKATMPSVFDLTATGDLEYPFNPDKLGGNMTIEGAMASLSDRQFAFLPIKHVPALRLDGTVDYHPGEAEGSLTVTCADGRIAADGYWAARPEDYDASIDISRFPVDAFMPELGVGQVTGLLKVEGRGYNPMAKGTSIDANVHIDNVIYHKEPYKDITLDMALHAGEATGKLTSHNPGADLTADFMAILAGDSVTYDLTADLRDINLQTLHLSDSLNNGQGHIESQGTVDVKTLAMDVRADVSRLIWRMPGLHIQPDSAIIVGLNSQKTNTLATLNNGDLKATFSSPMALMPFVDSLTPAITEVMREVDSMRVDVRKVSAVVPRFALQAEMGKANVASEILTSYGMALNRLSASMSNDSLINFHADLNGIDAKGTKIDTVTFNAIQHGDYLVFKGIMNNRPGTFDDFAHVTVNGFAGFNRASVFMSQKNIEGKRGFNIGVNANIVDSIVTVKLVPRKPVIAYKDWQLNDSNFISFDLATKHLDADLRLSNGPSYLKIFTPAHEEQEHLPYHHHYGGQEDLIVQLSQVSLQDWLSINPFAPPIKGDLSADLHFRYEDPVITGKGTASLQELYYGRERVGTFDMDVAVANQAGGKLTADLALMVDSVRTITAHGVLNDSTLSSPYLLDFDMISFPLKVVNPFIPQGMAKLSGSLNGIMKITGDAANPIFDGYIDFDSAAVKVAMLGTTFKLSDEKIPVDSNVVNFNGFSILGCNENPLTVSGVVDCRHLSDINFNLDAEAKNIQVVNSNRPRGAEIYGKAFLDLSAKVKGNMQRVNVNADLAMLAGTNVTYVMTDAEQTLTSQSTDDMVEFVQFADTAQTAAADSLVQPTMAMNVVADLHIQEGSTVNVDLGGSNRAQVLPAGDLDFSMTALNGMRMTGRLNINGGFVRYAPPVLVGQLDFKFQEGSYVAFNGDVMNPVLNVHAIEVLRANVTQEGQNSRLVNFDITVGVTNTLENMNVAFDVSTDDDITVQNELQSMSPEQRANQAMNLLLYGQYTGAVTKANAKLSGNPLFSFLTSQLNNWAANNIKGVELSFGIDQYDKTYEGATSTTTSYSYRVSKSLFNDRFKIVVGGNYSTDANADENFSQNLINDISFEYMLNRSGSMYIRVFRHTGYESILEGEITQTGVGFVLKRKLNSLWELFGIKKD